MDTLGFEPRAFRMRSGCDTTTPCARVTRFCESSHQIGAMFMPRIPHDYGFGRAIAGVVRWATPATRPRKWQPRADQFGPRGLRESDLRGELARGRRQLTPALPPATVGIPSQFFRQCFFEDVSFALVLEMGEDSPHLFVQSLFDSHAGSIFTFGIARPTFVVTCKRYSFVGVGRHAAQSLQGVFFYRFEC